MRPASYAFWVIDHIYWQCQFFSLKNILGLSILVFGVNKERKNGALNVVDFAISHYLEKLSHCSQI